MLKLIAVVIVSTLLVFDQDTTGARLAIPNGSLAYDVAGSGPAVVFLHGAFMERRSWDAQWPVFAKQFRVVRYDLRPFGESTLEKSYSVPDDLRLLLDHLRVERAHIVGHSFGGGAAIDFALLNPTRVATLTLASAGPTGFVGPQDEQKAAMRIFAAAKSGDEALMQAWLTHPMWTASQGRPEVLKAIEASTRRSLAAFRLPFAPYLPVTPPAVERLTDVKAPTLVVVGDRDTAGNQAASALLAKQIPGAQLKVIAGADHALPLGWAAEFNAAALAFISKARR